MHAGFIIVSVLHVVKDSFRANAKLTFRVHFLCERRPINLNLDELTRAAFIVHPIDLTLALKTSSRVGKC